MTTFETAICVGSIVGVLCSILSLHVLRKRRLKSVAAKSLQLMTFKERSRNILLHASSVEEVLYDEHEVQEILNDREELARFILSL